MTNGSPASLVDALRCPACAAPLAPAGDGLACAEGHAYPVVDGIPVLVDEATLASDPQYAHQRAYFDAEFAELERYELERWRVAYLERLRAANALGGPGRPLVDVGVGGSGYTVVEAAREGRPALGCDLSLEALRIARRLAASQGVADRTLFVCCSAERLPLASGAFDVALAIAVLEHLPDDGAAIAELARVLAPGGRAWITVPHALRHAPPVFRPANRRHDRRLGHLRRYEAEDLLAAAGRHGLAASDVQFTGHAVKVAQLALTRLLPGGLRDSFWWWCERRDQAAARRRPGAMQLSAALVRQDG